jgi:hypothetical protein
LYLPELNAGSIQVVPDFIEGFLRHVLRHLG